jgi:putative ABC transport system permease protein
MILRDVTADLRHAIRRLIRTPGFAALAVVMLGIGIGAATSVFSLAYTIWLKPLPYRAPDELVSITSTQRRTGFGSGSSAAELGDIRANVPSFSAVAGYHYSGIFARIDGEPLQLASYPVSVNFFAVLGVEPQLGRGFSPDDEGQPVAILSDDFWRTRLHGDPNVLGRMIGGLEEQVRVVGVMPRDFRFPMQLEADCWSPTLRPTDDRSTRITNLVARLAPGASIDRANAELSALSTRLATAYPASNADWLMRADPFAGAKSTAYRAAFTTLLAMAGLFLLIASANIASLFVARNLTRRHELTVTLAIGAPRWRLARALLVESAILSLAGGALAVLLTAESTHAFARWMPWSTPRLGDLRLNGVVLTFAIAVAACTAALCALAPIAGLRSLRLTESLVGARTIGGASNRGQHTLVIVEIALAAVLLMGGGAMVRSFNDLLNSDRGYVPAGVATMSVSVPYDEARYEAAPARLDAYDQVLASIAKVPGVMAVGAVTGFPGSALGILGSGAVTVPGRTDPPVVAALHSATPDYFRAIGVALKSGRTFTPADRAGGPHVVVISETLERALWPGGRSIGQHFAIPPAGGLMRNGIDDAEVVGVVADMRLSTRRTVDIFVPFAQIPSFWADVVVRTTGDPAALSGPIRQAIRRANPNLLIEHVSPLQTIISNVYGLQRAQSFLTALVAILGGVVALTGVYALLNQYVAQRRREMGIRLALGSNPRGLFWFVFRRGMRLAVAGTAIGLGLALVAVRILRGQVFGLDGATWFFLPVGLAVVLASAVVIAASARRVIAIDPLISIRQV